MGFVDQRQNERFEAEQEARVRRPGGEEIVGVTENLSLGGARLRAPLEPPARIGERLQVRFSIPGHEGSLQAEAVVRWRNELDATAIGVQFVTGFRAKETFALSRFLEGLAKQRRAGQ